MVAADRSPMFHLGSQDRLTWALLGGAVLILLVLFADPIANLWYRWGKQEELSHSYFIPLISAWLVWTNRDVVKDSIGAPSWVGLAIIVAGLLSLVLGRMTSIYLFQHLGLVTCIAGMVAAFGGLSLLRTTAAPVGFLFFAVPPPFWAITVLSWNFQLMSSVLGVAMLEMMNIPVFLSGNVIDLGDYKLQVAEACSGLRYLFPFVSIGVMAGYMYRGPFWHKLIIVLSTIPITILMNSFRIGATGALVAAYGPEHAEGALHFFEGWVVFVFCLAALFGVIAILGLFTKPKQSALDALATPELPRTTPTTAAPLIAGQPRGAVLMGLIAIVSVAFIGISKTVTVETLTIPERELFAKTPSEFEGWRSTLRPLTAEVAETLGADDTIVVDLVSPEDEYINLYMAYLSAQRDGRSWHSPRQCIPGGGWKIEKHDIVRTRASDGRPFAYNRMIIANGSNRQLVYYWYDQRGRKMANEFVMKFYLLVDAVLRKRGDGAMVRVITPISNDTSEAEADEKIQKFIGKLEGFLPKYIPL